MVQLEHASTLRVAEGPKELQGKGTLETHLISHPTPTDWSKGRAPLQAPSCFAECLYSSAPS